MKRKPTAVLLSLCLALCALFSGCNVNVNVKDVSSIESRARQVISRLAESDEESDSAAEESPESSSKASSKASSKKSSKTSSKTSSKAGSKTSSKSSSKASSKASSKTSSKASSKASSKTSSKASSKASSKTSSKASSKASSKTSSKTTSKAASYTMADVKALKNTEHFAKKTLEHIFDGTINSKGNATGYHYSRVTDSKGEIIAGTESARDSRGVFTAKVKVSGVKKNGFSSFYPEDWSPQQVVDAINEAYQDALSDKSNPHGELWIGYSGDLEIDMYLDSSKKITTAYPIYEGD